MSLTVDCNKIATSVAIRLMLTLDENKDYNLKGIGEVRRWRRLVRIAYFDEAGTSKPSAEPYLVVGGVLIHGDTEWQPVESAMLQIKETLVPPKLREQFVFHAMHLFGGHPKYEGLLCAEERFQILREVVNLIPTFKLPIAYAAVKRATLSEWFPNVTIIEQTHEAHQIAFALCVRKFQSWFTKKHADEMALCVAAKNDQKNRQLELKNNYRHFRERGLTLRRSMAIASPASLLNFVDALHFASPNESIGLQLADCVTFVIKRQLMGKKKAEELYEPIRPLLVCKPNQVWPPRGPRGQLSGRSL
jgi:hypothetical protein